MGAFDKQFGCNVIAFVFLCLAMVSCRDEDGVREGYGHIAPVVEYRSSFKVYGTEETVDFDISEYVQGVVFTLATADGNYSHDWVGEFPVQESFLPGGYKLSVSVGSRASEGFKAPYFVGSTSFTLEEGEREEISIDVEPGNVMAVVTTEGSLERYFSDYSVIIHSEGGQYISVGENMQSPLFIMEGNIDVMLEATVGNGKSTVVGLGEINDVRAGICCRIEIKAIDGANGYPVVMTSFVPGSSSDDTKVALNEDMFDTKQGIECIGFISGDPYIINEGVKPVSPLLMEVDNNGLKSLTLSANWLDKQVDILNGSAAQLGLADIKVERGEKISVDFTDVIPQLRASEEECFVLSMQAAYLDGTMSMPAVLEVKLMGADVAVLSAEPVMSGVNIGRIIVSAPEDGEGNLSVEVLNTNGHWEDAANLSVTPTESGYELLFDTDQSEGPVFARVLYCGEVKATVELKRVWPAYGIEVDAFATRAVIRIVPADDSLLKYITVASSIYANGEKLTILTADIEEGLITVVGLKPETQYRIQAALPVAPSAADYTTVITVKTEKEEPLPNGDFEDVKSSIRYENMPSGGRYSQNITPIFNQQNFASFDVYMPMEWTSVNAKTFCLSATNRNTWYLQPSTMIDRTEAYSGARSVKIIDTAWDVTGQDIPDYLQTGLPYKKYSLNIPEIKYRATGKLFLGSYKFDPINLTEVYQEGIGFTSRPSSLNGFYKFIPGGASADKSGYVGVQILGMVDNEEKIIAEGEIFLPPATGFTAFSVPLSYHLFGVKARRAKVMFASSTFIGDIEYETVNVSTTSNPENATSTGNTLWIDAVDFSY